MTKTLEIVWIILVGLTIFAYLLGHLHYINSFFVAILLVTTFIKVQLVLDYFMELKDVRLHYRLIPTFWLVIVISLISLAYYLPVVTTESLL